MPKFSGAMMNGRYLHLLLLILACDTGAAEPAPAAPPEPSLKVKLYLEAKDEVLVESTEYGIKVEAILKRLVLHQNLVVSLAGEYYYQIREVELEEEQSKTETLGLGLARLEYNGWTEAHRLTPYLRFALERTRTEVTDQRSETTFERSNIWVWGAGVRFQLHDAVAVDLSISYHLDNPTDEELFDVTEFELLLDLMRF